MANTKLVPFTVMLPAWLKRKLKSTTKAKGRKLNQVAPEAFEIWLKQQAAPIETEDEIERGQR